MQHAEASQFIQAEQMIEVFVRVDDRVDVAQVGTQALHPKIRRGVDDQLERAAFDVDRRAKPFVQGIRRAADIAIATDHGDAIGGPRS